MAVELDMEDLPLSFPALAVNFDSEGVNPHGVYQNKCTHCGDCVSGCNYSAKNTTLMNYLPAAKNHGALMFTEVPPSPFPPSYPNFTIC